MRIYGTDDVCDIAVGALFEYVQFNKTHGSLDPLLDERIHRLSTHESPGRGSSRRGGTELVYRDDILRAAQMDLTRFFESRHSVRQFSPEPVPEEMLERAILMARNSPSVCNRQSFRVYAYTDPDQRKRVLKCQKGNAGFGEEIPLALIVSCDLQTFFSVGERNQCWIDGGLFSMSLVYALHSLGLGTICLNWCAEKDLDRELHLVAEIPESEVIIMLMGAGFLPATLRVAQSPRRSLDKVLVWGHKGKTT